MTSEPYWKYTTVRPYYFNACFVCVRYTYSQLNSNPDVNLHNMSLLSLILSFGMQLTCMDKSGRNHPLISLKSFGVAAAVHFSSSQTDSKQELCD